MMPVLAMGMLLCVTFCGLTVDVARMQLTKLQMQNAADAGALGAELESERAGPGAGAGPFDWAAHGQEDAALNGFTNGVNNTTVTVTQNPTSGPYAGRYDAIQVTITQTYQPIFLHLLNGGTYTLSATGVALVPPCSVFLGGSSSEYSYTFWNASARLISTCPTIINNNYVVDGFSEAWAFGLDIAGSSANSLQQGWPAQQTESGYGGDPPNVSATFNVPAPTDPLASITQPSFGSCSYTSKSITTGSVTLNPGTYCGTSSTPGLTITNATVTLNPGLYIITGGANWQSANVSGTGVTLFFTKGNGSGYGQMLVGNSGGSGPASQITLSAPTSSSNGGITGILFFADRNWTTSNAYDFTFDTYGSFTGDGIWYMPNAGIYIWLNGTFTMSNYGSFVARNIYFFGTQVTQNQNFSWLSGGSPFRTKAVLVQ